MGYCANCPSIPELPTSCESSPRSPATFREAWTEGARLGSGCPRQGPEPTDLPLDGNLGAGAEPRTLLPIETLPTS